MNMLVIRVTIIRYIKDSQPGWVECKLTDARGNEWLFIEKTPVVTLARLDANSHYPQPGVIACHIIDKWQDADGYEMITVDTDKPWGVESTTGRTRFDVHLDQLQEQ